MVAFVIVAGLLLTVGVVVVLAMILRPFAGTDSSSSRAAPPRAPRGRFESCPACDAPLFPTDRTCPSCRLDIHGRLAGRLDRVRIARREVRHLRDDGLLDVETADRVAEQLDRRRQLLRNPPAPETPRAEPPPLPVLRPVELAPPAEPVAEPPAVPVATTEPPPALPAEPAEPRRSLADVLGQFMHERNILWGELAGGLLIVGCSIALVLSLWRTLEELPYFTFLLFAGITTAVFAAGQYTLHHWKLTATSRGLLVIALLLTPLNLLLLADPGARGAIGALDVAVKVAAVLGFGLLVRTGARDLAGIDQLPGLISRRWLLALAVVGAPAALMVPVLHEAAPIRIAAWLPLGCYLAACATTVRRLSSDLRQQPTEPLDDRRAIALLVFIGLSLFALFTAWGFLLARTDELPAVLRHLAFPAALSGIPVLSAGLLIQRRVTEPPGLRATGTATALSGTVILFASIVLGWPDPAMLLLTASAVALILGWVAYRDELPWAYCGAIPCAAFAVILAVHGLSTGWAVPEGLAAGKWLARGVTSATSGATLVGFAVILALVSEIFVRRARQFDAVGYALGAAGVAAAGLLFVTVHGIQQPAIAAWSHLAAAIGFIVASFRWRPWVVAQAGVWLLLVASLWGLWALIPGHAVLWGLVIAIEGFVLSLVAVILRQREMGDAVVRLGTACRDVAAAATILAPVLALTADQPFRSANDTGTLFAVAATTMTLAGLYRLRGLTWIGSAVALLALIHWFNFTLDWVPKLGALLALLVHSTIAMVAAYLLPRLRTSEAPANEAQVESHFGSWLNVYLEPLRWSARLSSCLAVPLLLVPASGMAGAWAGLAVWTAALWLAGAVAWRERGAFSVFQAVLTWAAVLTAFAWVEGQEWYETSRFAAIDPRALQAYGLAAGLLSIGWVVARRALQPFDRAREMWAELRPTVDQIFLGALVIGQLLLAAGNILPAVLEELAPVGIEPPFAFAASSPHVWGLGGWLILGVLTVALGMYLRWPADETRRADGPVIGMVLLALSVPCLAAGFYVGDVAAASALRWGMGAVFLIGSALVVFREQIGRAVASAGFPSSLSPGVISGVRGLLAIAVAIVLMLTLEMAAVVMAGYSPSGPVAESIFRRIGWTASVTVPLGALILGLAATAWRERSAGYASAAGWVWTATIAGGFALGVVASGGVLDATRQMQAGLLALGATAAWAILWLAAERRVPGHGLLSVHSVVGLVGLMALAAIPLTLLMLFPTRPLGPASACLGIEGWLVLVAVVSAANWHAARVAPRWRFHVVGLAVFLAGVLAACTVQRWDQPGDWLSLHVLALTWAVAGIGMSAFLVSRRASDIPFALRLWPQVLAVGLLVLGLRGGWADPLRPLTPAGTVLFSSSIIGAIAFRFQSRLHEYLSGLLVALAAVLIWVSWGPDSLTSLSLAVAIGLSAAGAIRAIIVRPPANEPVEEDHPGDDMLGLPHAPRDMLPPFLHFAAAASLGLVAFGLIPTWSGATFDPARLAWGAVAAVAVVLGALLWDRRATYAAAGLYVVGVFAVGLAVVEMFPGPIWANWLTPIALAGYAALASIVGSALASRPDLLARARLPDREPGDVRGWLFTGQALIAIVVLVMSIATTVREPDLALRLAGPAAVLLLVPAAAVLLRRTSDGRGLIVRVATLAVAIAALAVLAFALPDPADPVPWLHRNAGLFVALVVATAVCAEILPRWLTGPAWAWPIRTVTAFTGGLAIGVLVVFLIQQIPHFNPDPLIRKTPLNPLAIGAAIVAILIAMALALRFALRPDRDPLGPKPGGRAGYVYLAQVLLVLLFVHVRLNVPQVFLGQAVRYWTFIVMLLAFVGVGLAELFARRGLSVLSRPLLRTGVLLPLIPLVAFWAKPPALVMEFADARAPGLRPMLGYLEKLPQHFDVYALLWFLAGLLYGLIALNRRSFGWALLGALATNAGLWALLSHHQVPAAIHPQAWAIPLALIVLISEHVNRHRLRDDLAASLRYLGISMIYVSSAADLFIAGVGQSVWLPVILAVLCIAGVMAGVLLRVRAFLYLGIGFLLLDVFSMIWHAAVDRQQTWVWYASGIVLGAIILALFALLEKRRNDVHDLVGRLRQWNR